jgi:hypothetical protein
VVVVVVVGREVTINRRMERASAPKRINQRRLAAKSLLIARKFLSVKDVNQTQLKTIMSTLSRTH